MVKPKSVVSTGGDFHQLLESLDSYSRYVKPSDIQNPDTGNLSDILKQRHTHRKIIFYFALSVTTLSLLVFFGIILLQIYVRLVCNPSFELFGGHQLEVLILSIFGQSIGVIALITKSLWDDTPYKTIFENGN